MANAKYKRILVIGDIHGCAIALKSLLATVQPTADDIVITLGDYIDRGPASYEVLEILSSLYAQGILVPLRGNHEMLLLLNCYKSSNSQHGPNNDIPLFTNATTTNPELRIDKIKMSYMASSWKNFGSEATISFYRNANHNGLAIIPEHHFEFFEQSCVNWYELDGYLFVHGGVSTNDLIEKTSLKTLQWKRTNPITQQRHRSGKIIVCGHTVQDNGTPGIGKNSICLDTGACCGGWLSCMELYSGDCWQSNEQGKTRKIES